MPASIFAETELARLASFPEEIPGDDLIRAFMLTGADLPPPPMYPLRSSDTVNWGPVPNWRTCQPGAVLCSGSCRIAG